MEVKRRRRRRARRDPSEIFCKMFCTQSMFYLASSEKFRQLQFFCLQPMFYLAPSKIFVDTRCFVGS